MSQTTTNAGEPDTQNCHVTLFEQSSFQQDMQKGKKV